MNRLLSSSAIAIVAGLAMPAIAQEQGKSSANQSNMASAETCMTSWTTVDADENGTISEAEANAATDAEFSRIDVDGDGAISVTEWKDCGDRASYPSAQQGLRSDQAATDPVNETGMAASSDQVATDASNDVEGMTTSPASDQAQADLQMDAPEHTGSISTDLWSEDEFTAADKDQSGDVTQQEAAASAETSTQGRGSPEDRARLGSAAFAKLDTDGDGKISTAEFEARGTANLEASIQARFGKIDSDGNGAVSKQEWQAYRSDRFSQAQSDTEEPTLWLYYYSVL